MAIRVSQTGSSLDWIFQPLNNRIVNPLTHFVTHRLVLPALKTGYCFLGNSTVQIVRKVSPEAANVLAERLADPISTETLLAWGQSAQQWSLQRGRQQPSSLPGAHYLDICSIIAARHLYIFTSDMNVILSAPRELRIKTEGIFTAAREEVVNFNEKPSVKSGGISRVYLNNLKNREFGKKAPQIFDSERVTIAEGQGTSENQKVGVRPTQPKTDSSGCFGINMKETPASTLGRLQTETYDSLAKQEKTTRQKIVQRGVEFFCSGVISSTVRTSAKIAIAMGSYKVLGEAAIVLTPLLSEELMEMARTITKAASAGIMSGGGLLFLRCTNTINNFFSAAQAFEVSASPLRDLAPAMGQENIDQIIETIRTELVPFVSEESLLTPFVERAKKHSIALKFENGSHVFAQNPSIPLGVV